MTAPVLPRREKPSKRALATGLLLLIAAIFLLTLAIDGHNFWLGLLRAAAEAALVGGIADWFAVTALFRRPLGLPIPHTAIVPMSKTRIGAGLANFLGENFLSAERLATTLRMAQPGMRLGGWMSERANARRAATAIIELTGRPGVLDVFMGALSHVGPGRLLRFALEALETAELDKTLLDEILRGAAGFMHRSAGRLEERAGRRRQGLLRRTLDRQVMRAIMEGLTGLLKDLEDESNPSRKKLLSTIRVRTKAAFAQAETATRFHAWLSKLSANRSLETFLGAEEGRADVTNVLEELIIAAGERLKQDEAARRSVDTLLVSLSQDSSLLREGVMKMIAEGARDYDTNEFSTRIERAVTDDLQYIRINGAVVGGMVGCLLFLVEQF